MFFLEMKNVGRKIKQASGYMLFESVVVGGDKHNDLSVTAFLL